MLQVYRNENTTNPEPVGYLKMMQYEEDSQRASDLAEEEKQEILEELEDDNLIDVAAELMVNYIVQNILMKRTRL